MSGAAGATAELVDGGASWSLGGDLLLDLETTDSGVAENGLLERAPVGPVMAAAADKGLNKEPCKGLNGCGQGSEYIQMLRCQTCQMIRCQTCPSETVP